MAAAALQTAAAQHRVHIDARATTFMDLLLPVCSALSRSSMAFGLGARLRKSQAEPGAAKREATRCLDPFCVKFIKDLETRMLDQSRL